MNFLDKLGGGGDKKKKSNPLSNVGKALGGGNRKFQGSGQSLGGSKPGKLMAVELAETGPLGLRVEKRRNTGSAIVAEIVPGSQAQAAGLERGDILCFAGTNGEEEIMYEMFIDMAKSPQRPLVFDIRRIETNDNSLASKYRSADAYSRKQAVIAAAEAREKAAKAREKPMRKGEPKKAEPIVDVNAEIPDVPQSEEARRAVEAAKKGESNLAAQLGYNPYETNKSTAGQARNATVATKHGAVGGGTTENHAAPGTVAPPQPATTAAAEDKTVPDPSPAFQQAFEDIVTSNDPAVVKSSFPIMQKLLINATTKGQAETEDATKFRKVRLTNAKIRAAITDVHGALDIMMSCGFELVEDGDETYLIFPPGDKGPPWLSKALKQMEQYEKSS